MIPAKAYRKGQYPPLEGMALGKVQALPGIPAQPSRAENLTGKEGRPRLPQRHWQERQGGNPDVPGRPPRTEIPPSMPPEESRPSPSRESKAPRAGDGPIPQPDACAMSLNPPGCPRENNYSSTPRPLSRHSTGTAHPCPPSCHPGTDECRSRAGPVSVTDRQATCRKNRPSIKIREPSPDKYFNVFVSADIKGRVSKKKCCPDAAAGSRSATKSEIRQSGSNPKHNRETLFRKAEGEPE